MNIERLNIHFVIIINIVWTSINVAGGIPIIEEHPSSLLLQVHEAGIFSCVADACLADQLCSGRWRINGSYTHSVNNQPLEEYVSKGFAFSDNRNGNRLTLMLIVNASEPIQNTSIYCEFDDGSIIKSDTAYLQVIRRQHNAEYTPATSPTMADNPSVMMNSTHVMLTWSPLSLWPGHIIQYYNVSFANKTDGSTTYNRINSASSNGIVYFAKHMPDDILTCTEFTFAVSAINTSGFVLQKFSVSSYMAPTVIQFPSTAINSTVLYKYDGTFARVEVYVNLPESICSFQEINYTLLVEGENEQLVTTVGPIVKVGPGVLKETIVSNLKGNQVYSLIVRAELYSQLALSNKHYFNTLLKNWDTNTRSIANEIGGAGGNTGAYKAATGVSLTLVIVMLLALVFVIISVYMWHKHRGIERRCQESKQRVCQTMVPNPIYDGDGDGPVYDSVRPQYETLVAVAPARFTQTHQASSVTESSHNNDADVVRYVDPPVQLPQFRSQSFAHTIADTDGGSASRSYSISLPPPRVMALKRNGQERNKLHLTLSLGGSEADHNTEAPPVPTTSRTATNPVVPAEPMDESYMVMNSASVLSSLQNVGCTQQSDA